MQPFEATLIETQFSMPFLSLVSLQILYIIYYNSNHNLSNIHHEASIMLGTVIQRDRFPSLKYLWLSYIPHKKCFKLP